MQIRLILLELGCMIAYVKGRVKNITDECVILENAGIGYEIFLSEKLLAKSEQDEEAEFYVHDYLRENARELYGFASIEDLRLFRRLLSISGVGPRMAQGVISLGSLENLVKNIEKGNVDYISQVSGVGKKTAQKIIIELKGRLDLAAEGGEDEEVVQALKNLGCTTQQAREAVKRVSPETKETGERLREALRYLSK